MTRHAYAPGADRASFGAPEDDRAFMPRPAAYGLLSDEAGRLAVVRIVEGDAVWHDLPGGGIDPGESEAEALVREFAEETGLTIAPRAEIGRAEHLWIRATGESVRNLASYHAVEIAGPPGGKIEDDHTLVWMTPLKAIGVMRHEAAAWAIARWLRLQRPAD